MNDDIKFRIAIPLFRTGLPEYNGPQKFQLAYLKVFEINRDLSEDYKLMRYTGFKDKNGIEIYEGDIVKYEFQFDDSNLYIVEFGEGETCSEDYYSSSFNGWYINNGKCQNRLTDQEEVMGNIYQNSELIRRKLLTTKFKLGNIKR